MKKTPVKAAALALLLLVGLPFAAQAQHTAYPDSLWNAGVQAYTNGDYAQAVEDWEDVRATGLMSRELYYNLGNAYFKTGEIAPAILWYERALRLDPSDADVRYNLDFAKAQTQDKIDEVPEIFFEQWGHAMCYLLPSDTLAALCVAFFALTVGLVLLFLLGRTSGQRRLGFFAAIVTFILAFLGWDFAQWQKTEAERQDMAIVMRPVSSVRRAIGFEVDLSSDLIFFLGVFIIGKILIAALLNLTEFGKNFFVAAVGIGVADAINCP